jgi:hypothetical protein
MIAPASILRLLLVSLPLLAVLIGKKQALILEGSGCLILPLFPAASRVLAAVPARAVVIVDLGA